MKKSKTYDTSSIQLMKRDADRRNSNSSGVLGSTTEKQSLNNGRSGNIIV